MKFSISKSKSMLQTSKNYIFSNVLVAVSGYTGSIFLKFYMNESAIGYYTAAMTCAGVTNFVFAAIVDSARPEILESKIKNQDLFKKRMIQLYSIIIACALLQSILTSCFANVIILFLYGKAYGLAIIPLKIIVWQNIFAQIGTVRNVWILAEGKQTELPKINFVGAVANIVFNIILIPICGINGAAIAAVLTQFFTNVILGFIIKPIRENNKLMLSGCKLDGILELINEYRTR